MHVPPHPPIPYIYVAKLKYWVHIESTFSTYYPTFSIYSERVCKTGIEGGVYTIYITRYLAFCQEHSYIPY